MSTRQEDIHAKGFEFASSRPVDPYAPNGVVDYGKIKIGGVQTLDDAILDLGSLKKDNRQWGDKQTVLRALRMKRLDDLREISNYFFGVSGIYERLCKYFAFLYRYDWYVVPYVDDESVKNEKVLKDFSTVLNYLDNSNVKKMCGDIALEVIKNGCYYGYLLDADDGVTLQQLPVAYCRSRYFVGSNPAVEFNMKFFDDKFGDAAYRMRVLKLFPPEFAKGYLLYKQGKLKGEGPGDSQGWYLLDPDCAIKFNLNGSDVPPLVNAIPAILDLDVAQDLDRRKMMQQLLKVIIQKLPLDKNGDLIFDVDEAKDIHNNAVQMLKRAVGVDVMTTFAEVDVADLADKNTTTTSDELEKVERTVYNEFGVSQNLFNSSGNLSMEKSSLNDEASVRNLLLQFQVFLNKVVKRKVPSKKKYSFRVFMLETTINNYMELAKMYKEQTQLGYSKMLAQVALGHSQSAILATAHFENEVLHLYDIMIPPLMSSTMSSTDILGNKGAAAGATEKKSDTGGRPEKPDSQKSDKTIQNIQSSK